MIKSKKIVLGVSGSIAAYKTAELVRLFVKEGAEVKVVMTPSAKEFVTPLTLSTLSKNPVLIDFVKNEQGEWNNHVELGLWADLMLIAPASANTLAKMASGLCDNFLLACYLSAKCPVYVAPAMDLDMYAHQSTRQNLDKLNSIGNMIIDAEEGELASGLMGKGRMAEPEHIIAFIKTKLAEGLPLRGKKALVTAGPTYENIDPVRFIGNYSSGKMGFALAEELASKGAAVTVVCGPVSLHLKADSIKRIDVTNASQMFDEAVRVFPDADVAIMSAAVADYTPVSVAAEKIKKGEDNLKLELAKTRDILKHLGGMKKNNQVLVGFALETENEEANALKKLSEKNADMIVLNSMKDEGTGFQKDTNRVIMFRKDGQKQDSGLKSKREVAKDIVNEVIALLNA